MDKYLITLTGMGSELECCLIDKDTWNWVHKDIEIPDFLINEWPKCYDLKGMNKKEIKENIEEESDGADDNDKALIVMGCSYIFSSVREINEYVRKNNINIINEYVGAIY